MSDRKEPFWLVWNPAGRNPQYRHVTEDAARKEAFRLAAANPGHDVIVLEACACMRKTEITVTEYDRREIPF